MGMCERCRKQAQNWREMAKYTVVTIEYFDGPRKGQREKWRICQSCGALLGDWLLKGGRSDAVRDVPYARNAGCGADELGAIGDIDGGSETAL